jgi:GTP-binding protein HflX
MKKEKVLLVLIDFEKYKNNRLKHSIYYNNKKERIAELKNLAVSAGADVEETVFFKQPKPNTKYFINTGKLEQIKTATENYDIELVIFDDEITPTQQRNLQAKLNIKVLDRTALILDIFAQRAHSSEGKLQVELAQLNYILPRLTGRGIELSRLGGGIGTRGPGETKLEVDRRKIRKRISMLKKKIDRIGVQRDTQRKQREEREIFQIALVGYTNSGKTTLLNSTTDARAYVENRLFSTLDSTTRKLNKFRNSEVLISDTVGFIEKLPHQLIASFKSTLEEVRKSDLLLLLVDISSPYYENNIRSVRKVLKEIGVWNKPVVLVFNKIDKVSDSYMEKIKIKYKNAAFISALKKKGIQGLYLRIKNFIEKRYINVAVMIPYYESRLISFIYNNSQVLERKNMEDSALLSIKINSRYSSVLDKYIYRSSKDSKAVKKI